MVLIDKCTHCIMIMNILPVEKSISNKIYNYYKGINRFFGMNRLRNYPSELIEIFTNFYLEDRKCHRGF